MGTCPSTLVDGTLYDLPKVQTILIDNLEKLVKGKTKGRKKHQNKILKSMTVPFEKFLMMNVNLFVKVQDSVRLQLLQIFKEGDDNGDGVLTMDEFTAIVERVRY